MEKGAPTGLGRVALWVTFALLFVTPSTTYAQTCIGDCNGDGYVAVNELVLGIQIALAQRDGSACPALDPDSDTRVGTDAIVAAVDASLNGCPSSYPLDDELRLNQMQVLASHNSYHVRAQQPTFDAIMDFLAPLARSIDYSHIPLDQQFEFQGVRAIELDLFADPDGSRYAMPVGLGLNTGDPSARLPALEGPGFKVFHVQDIDFETTCPTFIACLQTVKDWSDAHPLHVPIMIQLELKDDVIPDPGYGFTQPLPFGPAEVDAVDEEIRSVFPPAQIITPDDVRGQHATLEEAILTDGWPTLGESRGRVLFTMDNEGSEKEDYLAGHPSLTGRIMFTSSRPGRPEAAFVKLNDPIDDFDDIQAYVASGYIVRTRADSDTRQARTGDTTDREAALASGAQFVSTDYPVPNPAFPTNYSVQIPGGTPARCNPISAPDDCTSTDIEAPSHLER